MDTLTIDRLTCRVNVAAGSANSGDVRDVVERIVRDDLAPALDALDLSLPTDDQAVYRVRDLRLELWLDPAGDSRTAVAERWSRLIGGAVAQALERGDPGRVVRFDSAQAFVLHFLRDLIDGRAWLRWYYDEFRPLRPLAEERAALELMIQRPAWIIDLLRALMQSGHGERLIARWRLGDFARLWAALGLAFAPLSETSFARSAAQIAPMWDAAALSGGGDADSRARDTFRLWLAAPEPDNAAFNTARMLVDVARLIRRVPAARGLLLMQTELYPALIARVEATDAADVLAWLLPLSEAERGRAQIAQIAEIAGGRGALTASAAISSPVGSVVLLALGLRSGLRALSLWEVWREAVGDARARDYLFVLLLKALGAARAPLLLGDPLLAAFAGLDDPPTADARLAPLSDTGTPAWAAAIPELAARLFPARSGRIAAGSVNGVDVLRDQAAGAWLAARVATGDPLDGWALDAPVSPMTADDLITLTAEADHLLLGTRLGYQHWLTPSLDAALAAAASLAIRRTAQAIPQFGASSPAYLASQFFAQPARLIVEADRMVARLSGSPLSVVLRMAAIPETIDLPWLALPLALELS